MLIGTVLFGDQPAETLKKAIVKGMAIKGRWKEDLFVIDAENMYKIYAQAPIFLIAMYFNIFLIS
jgi:hypothetical protein